jgi:hypothetical protein
MGLPLAAVLYQALGGKSGSARHMKTDWPQSDALKRACRNDRRSRLLEHGESSKIWRERNLKGQQLVDINDQADPVRVHAHATLRFPPESSTRWGALHRVRLVSYRAVCRDDSPGLVVPSKAHIVCESAARICRCYPAHSRGTNGEVIRVGRRRRGSSRGCRDACEHGSGA